MAFAKLWGTGNGQVLVKIDTGPEGAPEVRFFCQPPGLGVCSFAIGFEDSDDGWDKAEAAFESMNEERGRQIVTDRMAPFLEAVTPNSN